ncbi:MAG: hypothetical protein ACLGXA_17710 [Acidobacteriota bacterium]
MPDAQGLFPGLTAYGNYENGSLPTKGIYRIPLDVSIRKVKSLGIPYAEIVSVELAYGTTYLPRRVGYAVPSRYRRKFNAALKRSGSKRATRVPQPHPDLLLCIREASRAAHRERDAATEAYSCGRHTLAGNAKQRKNNWYELKDRGIVAAHKQGLVRYIGASPQGMAVYEYGGGGMSCFHSTLHPAGAERTLVEGHPETLLVTAKDKEKGISLVRVEVTLSGLLPDTSGYDRIAAPRIAKPAPECWTCGELGHVAADCLNECWNCGEYHPGSVCRKHD